MKKNLKNLIFLGGKGARQDFHISKIWDCPFVKTKMHMYSSGKQRPGSFESMKI